MDAVRAFGRKEAYVRLLVTRGEGPLGRALSTVTPDIRSAVARDVRVSLVNYQGENGVEMPGAVWIVTAVA